MINNPLHFSTARGIMSTLTKQGEASGMTKHAAAQFFFGYYYFFARKK